MSGRLLIGWLKSRSVVRCESVDGSLLINSLNSNAVVICVANCGIEETDDMITFLGERVGFISGGILLRKVILRLEGQFVDT